MNVAVYRRIDNNKVDSEFCLSSQLEKIQNYCCEKGLDISDVYTDMGFSGISMKRPQLTRLLEDSKSGAFRGVVVYNLSRLTRNINDFFAIREKLFENGVELHICTEPPHGDIFPDSIQELFGKLAEPESGDK
jgi:Site-specific recombinases, DNA invertase Pin homologs